MCVCVCVIFKALIAALTAICRISRVTPTSRACERRRFEGSQELCLIFVRMECSSYAPITCRRRVRTPHVRNHIRARARPPPLWVFRACPVMGSHASHTSEERASACLALASGPRGDMASCLASRNGLRRPRPRPHANRPLLSPSLSLPHPAAPGLFPRARSFHSFLKGRCGSARKCALPQALASCPREDAVLLRCGCARR